MRALVAVAALAGAACAAEAPAAPPPTTTTAPTTAPPTTTTTAPTTTTHTHAPRAARGRPATTVPAPVVEVEGEGDDFWHRLAMCESGMRVTHNRYVGFFQFSHDTARKVGIDGSESYEEQRAAAQEWARRIHPNEGTRSGWPVCWWKAAA